MIGAKTESIPRGEILTMATETYIPQKTLESLAATHPEGTRHRAKIEIAIPLLGNGVPGNAVFIMLRDKFPAASEKEILDVISWCQSKNPTPSSPVSRPLNITRPNRSPAPPSTPAAAAEKFLKGFRIREQQLTAASPCKPNALIGQAYLLMMGLYGADEGINIVCKYTVNDKGKANPQGAGLTLPRDGWLEWMEKKGHPPFSEAGAWMRPNPVELKGSGHEGAICNADVTAFRFLLLESDSLPIDVQLSLYARLPLQISAIISTGGKSVHAWVRVDAANAEEYTKAAAMVLGATGKYGFDAANKNPSRLSRLPGVVRNIGGTGDKEQRLIYLNPEPSTKPIL